MLNTDSSFTWINICLFCYVSRLQQWNFSRRLDRFNPCFVSLVDRPDMRVRFPHITIRKIQLHNKPSAHPGLLFSKVVQQLSTSVHVVVKKTLRNIFFTGNEPLKLNSFLYANSHSLSESVNYECENMWSFF